MQASNELRTACTDLAKQMQRIIATGDAAVIARAAAVLNDVRLEAMDGECPPHDFNDWLDTFNAARTHRRMLTIHECNAAFQEGCSPLQTARQNDDIARDYAVLDDARIEAMEGECPPHELDDRGLCQRCGRMAAGRFFHCESI
jgi:hypothetical protein